MRSFFNSFFAKIRSDNKNIYLKIFHDSKLSSSIQKLVNDCSYGIFELGISFAKITEDD